MRKGLPDQAINAEEPTVLYFMGCRKKDVCNLTLTLGTPIIEYIQPGNYAIIQYKKKEVRSTPFFYSILRLKLLGRCSFSK